MSANYGVISNFDEEYIAELNKQGIRKKKPIISPEAWPLPDKVGYIKWVEKEFRSLHEVQLEEFVQQRFVSDYLQFKSPYRGLLLYHGLGAGKTRAAIATAEILINEKNVVVLLPASLQDNTLSQIQQWGHKYYSTNQHWMTVPYKSIVRVSAIETVPHDLIKKHKRLWVAVKGKTPNFGVLGDQEQKEIKEQINGSIKLRYKFINYRGGINLQKLRDMSADGNPFDNKVVIIDEAHNVISQVANGKRIAGKLYEMLMTARDIKIILLSGTPMINHVYEIALMLNLVRGYETAHVVKYASELSPMQVRAAIEQHHRVHRALVDSRSSTVRIETLPGYFVHGADGKARFDIYMRDEDIISDIKAEGVELDLINRRDEHYLALPNSSDEFDTYFIDEAGHIKNPGLFMRRILGTVSYFSAPSDLPRVNDSNKNKEGIQKVKVDMSDYQLMQYMERRARERKQDEIARKRKQLRGEKDGASTTNVYLAYSRAVINFAFPENIERPYPSTMRVFNKELDSLDTTSIDEAEESEEAKNIPAIDKIALYRVALDEAKAALDAGAEDYLGRNLQRYSPKFHAILQRIKACPGTALFYSQFRDIEGVGVFSKVLALNGYIPLEFKTVGGVLSLSDIPESDYNKPMFASFTSDTKLNNAILAIFNSETNNIPPRIAEQLKQRYRAKDNLYGHQMKVLMITQSGAEGINLRNVREVHICEPYWNQVRVDQVMGRAIRSGSHKNLPEKDRNVDVYMYYATFTKKQLRDYPLLTRKDEGLTSDQVIMGIAERKARIITEILELMKRAAVDCNFHHTQHPHVVCFGYPHNMNDEDFGREIDIHSEPIDEDYNKRIESVKLHLFKVTINKVPYIYVDSTNELFEYDTYMRTNQKVFVGYLKKSEKGYYKMRQRIEV